MKSNFIKRIKIIMNNINKESIKESVNLEQSLNEATTTELLYFMAKILEELTRRHKDT